jgi:hypothetical protein
VGCVTILNTKDLVAVLLKVTYTNQVHMLHVPSIDQVFKFLKRPMNAVQSLNVSLVVTI